MLYAIEGKITQIEESFVVVSVQEGLFLKVWITRPHMFHPGDVAKLFTVLKIREDRMLLYGFTSHNEKKCFEWLTEVPGVGPKIALQVLAKLDPYELSSAVLSEQMDVLVAVPGIGPSTAKKMIPYLSARMKHFAPEEPMATPREISSNQIWGETRDWLVEMGLNPAEADQEIRAYFQEHGALSSCETIVSEVLQKRKK